METPSSIKINISGGTKGYCSLTYILKIPATFIGTGLLATGIFGWTNRVFSRSVGGPPRHLSPTLPDALATWYPGAGRLSTQQHCNDEGALRSSMPVENKYSGYLKMRY